MTASRVYIPLVTASITLNACIPTTSTSFYIASADPVSAAQQLQYVCGKLKMSLFAPSPGGAHESPGAFGCESAPAHGYFLVVNPEVEKKQIQIYFAERAHPFSPEAKAIYADLVRELQSKLGTVVNDVPSI